MDACKSEDFKMNAGIISAYESSPSCTRFFCSTCGSHIYIKYSDSISDKWAGEVHFPTALLDTESVEILEKV